MQPSTLLRDLRSVLQQYLPQLEEANLKEDD
jgi:hypothetical protein